MSGAGWTYTLDNSASATTALDAGDAPTETFTITVSDGTASDTMTVTITVTGANDAPSAGSDQTGAITEDASTSTASNTVRRDADASASLTYSASNSEQELTVPLLSGATGPTTGQHRHDNALAAGASTTDAFTVTVSDGTASDTMTVTVTITGANDAPSITSTADTTAEEDVAYAYTTTASDADTGDTVTLQCTTVPSWMSCTAGALTGTPANADVGSHAVVITATDGTASTTDSFTVVVANANDAPTITSTAVTSVDEDAVYSYTVTANDADGDTLTMTGTTVPSWLTFTASTGVLTGTPTNDHVGSHSVVITVADAVSSVTDEFTIVVANTNDAPTISSTAVTSVNEDATYTYTVVGDDVDTGDTLTLQGTDVPSWLTFTAGTGVLTGIPTNDEVGSHSVTITVEDAAGATGTQTFTITVANTNDAPSISSTAVTAVDEDSAYCTRSQPLM